MKFSFDMLPSSCFRKLKWLWTDYRRNDGFPVRSIRVTPAGSRIEPFLPILVNRRSSTRNAEFSIGCHPPRLGRAPSNKIAPLGGSTPAKEDENDPRTGKERRRIANERMDCQAAARSG